jgi:hypothetical protein
MKRVAYAIEHETAFVQSFINRTRRERYLTKLASRKNRRTFLDRLNHQFHGDLDARYISRDALTWPDSLNQCYILADDVQFDGKLLSSSEAADAISSASFGIVVSFVPGKLACYQDEASSDLIWLKRG